MQRLNRQQQLNALNNKCEIKLIDCYVSIDLSAKPQLNFHSIGCLKEYFKSPPLEKIAKLQPMRICTVARNFKFNHVFQASAPGRICNVLAAKKD